MNGESHDKRANHPAAAGHVADDPTTCPSREDLTAFLHGVEDRTAEVQRIEWHLQHCPACSEAIGSLMEQSDTIARVARSAQRHAPHAAFFAEAQQRLLATEGSLKERDAAERPLPRHLGQYELLEPIGSGATGRVFKARHTHLDRFVVVKVLAPRTLPDAECVERFRREMRAVGRLAHPNVIHASDASEADGFYYIVMEYCDGLTLSKVLENCRTLSIADACEIVGQTANGLQAAREHGIVHRDIKPSNLLLSTDGQVKILDLGLAEFCEPRRNSQGDEGATVLQAAGTPEYMAPEQWQPDQGLDSRTDIYALGCTLFKALTGHAPFRCDGARRTWQLRESHLRAPIPSILADRPDAPSELDAIIGRMLAKRREDRYSSPRRVARDVAPFAAGSDLTALAMRCLGRRDEDTLANQDVAATTLTTLSPPPRKHTRRAAVMALSAVAASATGVAIAWPLISPTPEDPAENPTEEKAAHWTDNARKVYGWDENATHEVVRVGDRSGLKVTSIGLALVALTDYLTPRIRIRAELPAMTASGAGLFYGFQEQFFNAEAWEGCYRLDLSTDGDGTPIVRWCKYLWRPGKMGSLSSRLRDLALPSPLSERLRIEATIRGPADIDVYVNGKRLAPQSNDVVPITFELPTTSGLAGVFMDHGSQEYFDFAAEPLPTEASAD